LVDDKVMAFTLTAKKRCAYLSHKFKKLGCEA